MQKLLPRSFFRLTGTFGKHLREREQTIVLVMNTILALMYLLRHIFSSYLAIVCDIDLGVMLPPPPFSQPVTTAEEHRKEIYFNTTWEFSRRFSSIRLVPWWWWFVC